MFAFRFEKVIRCGNTMPDPDADASLSPAQSAKIPHPAAILKVAQYTSGSTGQPKGVVVHHSNILHNSKLIRDAMGYSETLMGGGWLPFFHDMGLIGLILQPVFLGATSVLMSPTSFIKRPANWLKMISKYRLEASGGPNFGYEHCLSRLQEQELAGVDLSCWRLCFSGSEPVREDIIRRFLARFGRYGLASTAFYPCYGMAETTLFVAGGKAGERHRVIDVDAHRLESNQIVAAGPASARRQTMVSCGTSSGFDLAIAAVKTKPSAALNRGGLDRRCARQLLDKRPGRKNAPRGPNQRMGSKGDDCGCRHR